MNQTLRDDTPRWKPPPEFLRELPDLISGKEPELLRPEAQAWLRRDPQAREYAQEICAAIAMFDGVPSRLTAPTREPISAHAKRSVQRAVRQLPQRLAEVLWPLLTIELDRVAARIGGWLIVPTLEAGTFASAAQRLFLDRDRLIAQLALHKNRNSPILASLEYRPTTIDLGDACAQSRKLIDSFGACLPKHSLRTWSELLLDYYGGTRSKLNEWQDFILRSRITTYHDHVLQTGALVCESRREFGTALQLCDQLFAAYPSSSARTAAAYTALKISLIIGDDERSSRYLQLFSCALDSLPDYASHWRRQFLIDATDWQSALVQRQAAVCDVLAILGSRE